MSHVCLQKNLLAHILGNMPDNMHVKINVMNFHVASCSLPLDDTRPSLLLSPHAVSL